MRRRRSFKSLQDPEEAAVYLEAILEDEDPGPELLKVDNRPASRGCRTQFLKRLVEWVEQIGLPVPRLDEPPYPSKDNPIERWGAFLSNMGMGQNAPRPKPCWLGQRG